MTAISQTIPNYVLGISEQPDQLKTPGQVRDLVNVIPDVTGMCKKRPGTEFLSSITSIHAIRYKEDATDFDNFSGSSLTYQNVELKSDQNTTKAKVNISVGKTVDETTQAVSYYLLDYEIVGEESFGNVSYGEELTAEFGGPNNDEVSLTFVYEGLKRSGAGADNSKWFTINNSEYEQYIGRIPSNGEVEMYRLVNRSGPYLIENGTASGLPPNTSYFDISASGGSGSGLTIDLEVDSNGNVASGYINKVGKFYNHGDLVSVSVEGTSGTNVSIQFYYYETTPELTLPKDDNDQVIPFGQNLNSTSQDVVVGNLTITNSLFGQNLTWTPVAYNEDGAVTDIKIDNPGNGLYLSGEALVATVDRTDITRAVSDLTFNLFQIDDDNRPDANGTFKKEVQNPSTTQGFQLVVAYNITDSNNNIIAGSTKTATYPYQESYTYKEILQGIADAFNADTDYSTEVIETESNLNTPQGTQTNSGGELQNCGHAVRVTRDTQINGSWQGTINFIDVDYPAQATDILTVSARKQEDELDISEFNALEGDKIELEIDGTTHSYEVTGKEDDDTPHRIDIRLSSSISNSTSPAYSTSSNDWFYLKLGDEEVFVKTQDLYDNLKGRLNAFEILDDGGGPIVDTTTTTDKTEDGDYIITLDNTNLFRYVGHLKLFIKIENGKCTEARFPTTAEADAAHPAAGSSGSLVINQTARWMTGTTLELSELQNYYCFIHKYNTSTSQWDLIVNTISGSTTTGWDKITPLRPIVLKATDVSDHTYVPVYNIEPTPDGEYTVKTDSEGNALHLGNWVDTSKYKISTVWERYGYVTVSGSTVTITNATTQNTKADVYLRIEAPADGVTRLPLYVDRLGQTNSPTVPSTVNVYEYDPSGATIHNNAIVLTSRVQEPVDNSLLKTLKTTFNTSFTGYDITIAADKENTLNIVDNANAAPATITNSSLVKTGVDGTNQTAIKTTKHGHSDQFMSGTMDFSSSTWNQKQDADSVTTTFTSTVKYKSGKAGEKLDVYYEGNAKEYLKNTEPSLGLDTLTIDDFTFISNRQKPVKMTSAKDTKTINKGFVNIINLSANKSYTFKIVESGNETDRSPMTVKLGLDHNADYSQNTTADPSGVEDEILKRYLQYISKNTTADLKTKLEATQATQEKQVIEGVARSKTDNGDDFSDYKFKIIGNGLLITSTRKFKLESSEGNLMQVFNDSVQNIALLPSQCQHGYRVKVVNSDTTDDDYYVRFVGDNDQDGTGYWEEYRAYDVLTTIDKDTMPHEMRRNEDGSFTVRPVEYAERFVGDDYSNPPPSFVGSYTPQTDNADPIGNRYINGLVNFRNRFGFLSGENVILSRPGDYFNFFNNTALTVSPKDPIDVSVSDTESATLFSSIETNVGLVLFSENQQFLLGADADVFSPSTAKTKFLSGYRYNRANRPFKMGTTIGFLNQDRQNSRVYEMQQQLRDGEPEVVELSKIVSSKLPPYINIVSHSKGANLLMLSQRGTKDIWCHRYFNTGTERLQSSWFRWDMGNDIYYHTIHDDIIYFVKKIEEQLVLERIDLNKFVEDKLFHKPNATGTADSDFNYIDYAIYIDSWVKRRSNDGVSQPNSQVKFTLPYKTPSYSDSSYIYALWGDFNSDEAPDGSIELINGNSSYEVTIDGSAFGNVNTATDVYIGFGYEMQVEIPTIYVTQSEGDNIRSDTTSSLTVQRLKFDLGRSGEVKVDWYKDITANSRQETTLTFPLTSQESNKVNIIVEPLFAENRQVTVPVYCKNTDLGVTFKSDSPYPTTLISMTWEGNYTNKYYKRP